MPEFSELVLYLWGSNSRAESSRAKRLGWKPHAAGFFGALEEDVTIAVKQQYRGEDRQRTVPQVEEGHAFRAFKA